MTMTSAERQANRRQRLKDAGLPDTTRSKRKEHDKTYRMVHHEDIKKRRPIRRALPFVGCDGEGCGKDELGRQDYMLFRMGERELFTGQRLTTEELLDFICDAPVKFLYVGFAFNYDVTQILRDLPLDRQCHVFKMKDGQGEPEEERKDEDDPIDIDEDETATQWVRYTWFKHWDIEYLPKQFFRVRRAYSIDNEDGTQTRVAVKGSTRTIYETFGFFQKSFLQSIQEFGVIGKDDLQLIAKNKAERDEFSEITQEIRDYCASECHYLAELMEFLRCYCEEAKIMPHTWNGAGKLATALHRLHGTPTKAVLEHLLPDELCQFASDAYYGGRFEITRTGLISQKVHEYDINSAYPAEMQALPCLLHGKWQKFERSNVPKSSTLYVAKVSFGDGKWSGKDHFGKLCGLPIRVKDGYLFWPRRGLGTYWNCEIESARKIGHTVTLKEGWAYIKQCDCQLFDWVEEKYDYRKSIGSQGPGYPIKLGLNSLYGKLAQRIGNGQYTNLIWAGLITSRVRSKLNMAIAAAQGNIVMIATDGVYSLEEIPELEIGGWLGAWEHKTLEGMFVIQPGLYWDPTVTGNKQKRKSRGFSGRYFEEEGFICVHPETQEKVWMAKVKEPWQVIREASLTDHFQTEWNEYLTALNSNLDVSIPKARIAINQFTGMKIALARGKPDTAGCWTDEIRTISFDWRHKRAYDKREGDAIVSMPHHGFADIENVTHKLASSLPQRELIEEMREIAEDQPEFMDFGPPFRD